MKILFKKYGILGGILLTITLTLTILTLIPTKYDLIVPAGIDEIEQVYKFKVDGKELSNDSKIYSVGIFEYYNVNCLNYLLSKINPYSIINEHFELENTSKEYSLSSGTIQKNVSLINALIVGYENAKDSPNYLGESLEYEFKGFIVHSLYGPTSNILKLGDIITEINGEQLVNDSSINKIIYYNDDHEFKYEEPIHLKLIRNKEEVELDIMPFTYDYDNTGYISVGFSCYPYHEFIGDTSWISYNDPDNIGPSAGLMQAVYTYLALTNEVIPSSYKICGTGTIDVLGNVGSIGGVESKICAAIKNHVDVFFVPEANYNDAYNRYIEFKTDMKLVKVNSFNDVIEYLNNNVVGK